MDWSNFRFIDLFAGIGGIRLGFEAVGGHCVFSSEFDEAACNTVCIGGFLFDDISVIKTTIKK